MALQLKEHTPDAQSLPLLADYLFSLSPANDRLHRCGALCLTGLKMTALTALKLISGFGHLDFFFWCSLWTRLIGQE